jgi:UDP-N-acetylmuramoyl-tripeptide--D-alanyl-D-alanine ligase
MDAYNANPSSMQASIKSMLSTTSDPKTFILGDMLELGEYAANEHQNILEILKKQSNIQIFLVGKNFGKLANEYQFQCFDKVEKLCEYLSAHNNLNQHILIKGSRGIQLEKILDYL